MKTKPIKKEAMLTQPLEPKFSFGPNSFNAKTNADWLRMECDRHNRKGGNVVVIEFPNGAQCLAVKGRVMQSDAKVIHPKEAIK